MHKEWETAKSVKIIYQEWYKQHWIVWNGDKKNQAKYSAYDLIFFRVVDLKIILQIDNNNKNYLN